MTKYFNNLIHIIQHKWFVLIECWKNGLYLQGITHDLSKFSLLEFYSYSWAFFANHIEKIYTGDKYIKKFQYAWLHHQHNNKHHWNYWVVNQNKKEALPIPEKYVKEMICDWSAMSRKFGDTPQEFFNKNRNTMVLHPETILMIENHLNIKG